MNIEYNEKKFIIELNNLFRKDSRVFNWCILKTNDVYDYVMQTDVVLIDYDGTKYIYHNRISSREINEFSPKEIADYVYNDLTRKFEYDVIKGNKEISNI